MQQNLSMVTYVIMHVIIEYIIYIYTYIYIYLYTYIYTYIHNIYNIYTYIYYAYCDSLIECSSTNESSPMFDKLRSMQASPE